MNDGSPDRSRGAGEQIVPHPSPIALATLTERTDKVVGRSARMVGASHPLRMTPASWRFYLVLLGVPSTGLACEGLRLVGDGSNAWRASCGGFTPVRHSRQSRD